LLAEVGRYFQVEEANRSRKPMTFHLSDVVPWGRNFAEYVSMFALTDADLRKSILGCGDGPASFNCEATEQGVRVVSSDPIYRYPAHDIRARIDETAPEIARQLRANVEEFIWRNVPDPDAVVDARLAAMRRFLADYPAGAKESRYVDASLPTLPFGDQQFELSLCSHFLFLYSQEHDLDFHLAAIDELCRISKEVRIFPLMELGSVPSRHLEEAISHLRRGGHAVERVKVGYEFQRGADEMLCIVPGRLGVAAGLGRHAAV
jgi:hypothetical protein